MSLTRPSPHHSRSTLGRLQAMLYRHRWVRFLAAGSAAVIVVIALRGTSTDPAPSPVDTTPPGPAAMLAPGTRGVPIPTTSEVFAVQDWVDLHAVIDGSAVVQGALIVDVNDDEVVVAVPDSRVDATVDALATGGVMLVLVPSQADPTSG